MCAWSLVGREREKILIMEELGALRSDDDEVAGKRLIFHQINGQVGKPWERDLDYTCTIRMKAWKLRRFMEMENFHYHQFRAMSEK